MSLSSTHKSHGVRIVMIDDSPADTGLVKRSLKRMNVDHTFEAFLNGPDAVTSLSSTVAADIPPDLILLDLNMPGMSGHDVLTQLKSHDTLSSVPVVVLSTSSSPDDVNEAYHRKANAYVNKPPELQDFQQAIEKIYSFWCDAAILPE